MSAPSDHQRYLSERGQAQVRYTAERLSEWPKRWSPEGVWVSDAQRTQETYQALRRSWVALQRGEPQVLSELYLASPQRWRETLSACLMKSVLCVGHNPGLSDLVGQLCGEWVNLEVGEAIGLCVYGQVSWAEALEARWELRGRVRPTAD